MKKRKVLIECQLSERVYSDEKIKIMKDDNNWFFEIGKEITCDLAEAVAILIRNEKWNSPVWDLEINHIDSSDITPEKALFWLTGGPDEWQTLDNYSKSWSESYLSFQEEFGILVILSLQKSKTFGDVRENFTKYLNLATLYDFALSQNLIRH